MGWTAVLFTTLESHSFLIYITVVSPFILVLDELGLYCSCYSVGQC